MNDILLTHDQQGDAIDAALKRCVADKELSPAHEIAAESCRAQVRKVYDYMRTHWIHARKLDYHSRTAQDNTVQLTIKSADWQALKAAGEESDAILPRDS